MVIIKSKTDGFRRCGVAHSAEGRKFPDGFFTDEQLEQLEADPEISVTLEEAVPAKLELDNGNGDEPADDAAAETDEAAEGAEAAAVEPEAEEMSDLAAAAGKAIEAGNTIGSGAPSVEAMEDILGRSITAAERDAAWKEWQQAQRDDA